MTREAEVDFERMTEDVLDAARPLWALAVRTVSDVEPQITAVQFRALIILFRRGPLNLKELAERLALQPPTVSRLCDRLVNKGLITRRPSPTSARYVELAVSKQGDEVIRAIFAARRAEIAEILRLLTPDQRAAVWAALRTFAAAARGLRGEPDAASDASVV